MQNPLKPTNTKEAQCFIRFSAIPGTEFRPRNGEISSKHIHFIRVFRDSGCRIQIPECQNTKEAQCFIRGFAIPDAGFGPRNVKISREHKVLYRFCAIPGAGSGHQMSKYQGKTMLYKGLRDSGCRIRTPECHNIKGTQGVISFYFAIPGPNCAPSGT